MRLQRIEIENYGLFTDTTLDFHDGFHLIFGPNEAGKSTLLQLVREVLFGFPTRSPYAFASHTGEMAATATLRLSDQMQVRYRRRKGRKNAVVGKIEPGERELDAAALTRLLGGANLDLYEQVFGFSLAELASGEKSLEQANLNEALYGGGLGGLANFQKVQADLKEEAESLFTSRGTTKTVNRLLKRIKETSAEIRKTTVKPADYKKQLAACKELRERADQLGSDLDEQQARESHLQRIADALRPWLQLQAARQELASLDVPHDFPPDAAEELGRRKVRREELAHELDEFQQELDSKQGELDNIRWDSKLLEAESQIHSLNQRLTEIAGFRRDIPEREAEANAIKTAVRARLRELNPEWNETQLDQFRTSLEQRQTIERLKEEWTDLAQQRTKLEARRPDLEEDIARLQDRLSNLEEIEVPERLQLLLDREAAYASNLKSRQSSRAEAERLQREVKKLQDKLNGPLQTQLAFDERLPVPLEASVVEFQRQWDEADAAVRQAKRDWEAARREQDERRRELEQLDAQESVPDQQELLTQRRHRDEGWTLIRRKYVDEQTVTPEELAAWAGSDSETIADRYEKSVAQADDVADQRQAKAMAVAEHDQLTRSVASAAERVKRLDSGLAEAQSQADLVQAEWKKLWQACPFEPLPPDAMQQWLGQYEELEERQRRLEDASQALSELNAELEDFESQLRAELADESESLQQLLVRAKKTVDAARKNDAKRSAAAEDLPDKKRELQRIQTSLEKLHGLESDWQTRWEAALEEFGFPATWDVDVATQILGGLSQARSDYKEVESLEQRVREMRTGLSEFEEDAAALCRNAAPTLADRPPENAIEELRQQLETAKQAQLTEQGLCTEVERLGKRVAAKQAQLEEEDSRIRQMLEAAEVESEAEFQQLAAAAKRKIELDRIVADATRELTVHRGTEPEAAFQEELEEADADSIAAERRQLQDEIRNAKATRDKLLEEKALADRLLSDMESASEAAGLEMDVQSARSELVSAVDRWAPLILAQSLMRRAIDKFQSEHQPAMMGEVERLFRRLTLDRYTGMERKLDERGTLLVVDQDGQRKEPSALSTGTREQLYLAIRLAYIIHYCRDAEPLPIVMDDVLVNFDDQRAVQTLSVLQEIATDVQILFLTCHQHVVKLYESLDPNGATMTLAKE